MARRQPGIRRHLHMFVLAPWIIHALQALRCSKSLRDPIFQPSVNGDRLTCVGDLVRPARGARAQAHTGPARTVNDEVAPALMCVGVADLQVAKLELCDALPDHFIHVGSERHVALPIEQGVVCHVQSVLRVWVDFTPQKVEPLVSFFMAYLVLLPLEARVRTKCVYRDQNWPALRSCKGWRCQLMRRWACRLRHAGVQCHLFQLM